MSQKLETVGDILNEIDGITADPTPPTERKAQFRLDLSPADYFAEPCPEPALTSSGIGTLIGRSPLHFWHEHPGQEAHLFIRDDTAVAGLSVTWSKK